ncbi:PEP-CTERM sorting domain-containing protein, partial [Paraglaciecola sp.]|uniref:PEP-CTERM sorting domain-containing protein n=1 Tax=Paraglaciecola sp. TaxID=1920173 RepID=UPI003EF0E595
PVTSLLIALLCLSTYSHATVSVLDFDSFQDGQIIDNEYLNSHGVSISSVNYKGDNPDILNRQVAFNTLNNSSRDNDLEFNNNNNDYNDVDSDYRYTALNMPGYSGASNPGNVLILQENGWGCSDGVCNHPDDEGTRAAGYFEFQFTNLVDILNIDFFDIEDQVNQDVKYYAIQFFDESNNEIHQNNYMPTMGDGQFVRQVFSGVSNVKRLIINMPGSGAIDNLAFKATEVPEPTTLAILFIALGFTVRHRLKKSEVSQHI